MAMMRRPLNPVAGDNPGPDYCALLTYLIFFEGIRNGDFIHPFIINQRRVVYRKKNGQIRANRRVC